MYLRLIVIACVMYVSMFEVATCACILSMPEHQSKFRMIFSIDLLHSAMFSYSCWKLAIAAFATRMDAWQPCSALSKCVQTVVNCGQLCSLTFAYQRSSLSS